MGCYQEHTEHTETRTYRQITTQNRMAKNSVCNSCGSKKHDSAHCWVTMAEDFVSDDTPAKQIFSYAAVVAKGVIKNYNTTLQFNFHMGTTGDTPVKERYQEDQEHESVCGSISTDDSGFTSVSSYKRKKKQNSKACEKAITKWNSQCKSNDEVFTCNSCSALFTFSQKKKNEYAEKKWKMPKKCGPCLQIRYVERMSQKS